MKKVSFFATVIILITSAALVMAGGHFGKAGMGPGMGGMGGYKAGMGPGMGGCAGMGPGMGGYKAGMGPGMGGYKAGMGPGMGGCAGMGPGMGGCIGMGDCMGPGMGGLGKGRMGRGCGMNPFILSGLDLTTEQTEAVQSLRESFEDDVASLRTQVFEKKAAMRDLWRQATLDAETIKAKQTEIHELKTQIREKATDFRLAVHELLTPEQLSELLESSNLPILSGLSLTADQTQTIQSLRESFQNEVTPLRTQVVERKTEMRELWNQAAPDAEAIRAKQAELHGLKGQIREKATDFRLAVRGVLTPEQVAKLVQNPDGPPCQRMGRGRGSGRGCGGARW